MPFNGSGTFAVYTPGNPVVTGTVISSTVHNATNTDFASGFTNCVTRDGQSPWTANIPAGGYKITGLGAGTANGDSVRFEQLVPMLNTNDFRLTLTTGVPVTTADVTAAETLYCAPYKGNRIALYDGSSVWNIRTSAEMSIDVPDATNCYDVFCYDNAGTPTLELTAWTNETTRATALTTQNGVLVKTGATTRRYLGTFYSTTAGNGQIEDSLAKRNLYNYYNRVLRPMKAATDATGNWTYTTATWRQANANTANQLEYVQGVSEDEVHAEVNVQTSQSGTADHGPGIGVDSTSADSSNFRSYALVTVGANIPARAVYRGFPGVGRHTLVWLERSVASGTTTWYNTVGVYQQSGISGEVFA